jgi:hypothetical protein
MTRACGPRRSAAHDTLKAYGLDSDSVQIWATRMAGEMADAVVAGQEWATSPLDASENELVTVAGFIEMALAIGVELGRRLGPKAKR